MRQTAIDRGESGLYILSQLIHVLSSVDYRDKQCKFIAAQSS